ncbi:MAG: bifunctional sugar-1-phosphate nucleotidylyltransferase/acetyltransferase [Candidatus Nanohaloarchaea archaeon]
MKAVILAAGQSSRFKPLSDRRHKGLTRVLGKPIIQHTVEELKNAGVEEIIVVQGPDRRIEDEIGDLADTYVVQEEPKGMGNALKQAREHLSGNFLVLTPYRANASQFFKPMIQKAEEEDAEVVFVSTPTDEPEKYGILEFDESGEKAVDMVEKPSGEPPSDHKVVGMYLLHEKFFDHLDEVEEWEYQYEDALSRHMGEEPASVLRIEEETNSIKYPWDLFSVVEELMEERGQEVSGEADIADSAEIKGDVIVEPGARIYENAVVKGPAYIGEDATVGNNAVVRDHVALEEDVTVGANCEVKNTVFQPGSSIHSQYIGDSVVGRDTKIGAGTIVANRRFREDGKRPPVESDLIGKDYSKDTGREFLGTFIGENVDIGVNVSIMPGVQVGSDSKIGPGTVVHENVEHGETVYVEQDVEKR